MNPYGFGPTQLAQARTDSAAAHDLSCGAGDANAEAAVCDNCHELCSPHYYDCREWCLGCLDTLFPGRHVRHNQMREVHDAARDHRWCECGYCQVAAIYGLLPAWRKTMEVQP